MASYEEYERPTDRNIEVHNIKPNIATAIFKATSCRRRLPAVPKGVKVSSTCCFLNLRRSNPMIRISQTRETVYKRIGMNAQPRMKSIHVSSPAPSGKLKLNSSNKVGRFNNRIVTKNPKKQIPAIMMRSMIMAISIRIVPRSQFDIGI